jgi:hypothetical protein
VTNTGPQGGYYYAEAYVAPGSGTVVRPVAGIAYRLSVSIVRMQSARR